MSNPLYSRIVAVAMTVIISAPFCSCLLLPRPPRFPVPQDLQVNSEVRVFHMDRDTVWKYARETVRDNYRLLKEDAVQGLLLTTWRKQTVRGTGRMSAVVIHGVKVDDRSDAPHSADRAEFELRNRIAVIVTGNADSSTVSVTNYFVARPKVYMNAFYEMDFVEVDDVTKPYSMSDFDTNEQFLILNRIGERVKNAGK